MKNYIPLLIFIILFSVQVSGQNDEILLTINDQKITKNEFERIYRKNNSSTIYDNKTVEEYLELFINFKLKVIEAESLGYDTIQEFVDELAGYREQLAKPYFEDKEFKEKLLHEAYERTINEVSASHIMIGLEQDAIPSDTLAAYEKIMEIRKRVKNGEAFDQVAKATSDDPSAKTNGGYLGWFTAFRMIYPFENVAYNTKVGEISMPVRTRFGYHIIKVEGKRRSMGQLKLAHILVLAPKDNPDERKNSEEKVIECYKKLQNGSDFTELVKEYSEDKNTINRNGELNWIRSGLLPENLESKVFSLHDSGDYTEPIPTEYGWHIFMLLDKKGIESFEELKPELEKKISRDIRMKLNELAVIERIKKRNNYKEYLENLLPIIDFMDETIYEGLWDFSITQGLVDPVFSINEKDYSQKDLAEYIANQKNYNKKLSFTDIVNEKFQEFSKEKIIEYEKSTLEQKYPEFRHLMEEYHDGILLFNLTDDMVWSKAVKDTVGLINFFEKNRDNYKWKKRIDISTYTLDNDSLFNKLLPIAKKRDKKGMSKKDILTSLCGSDTIPCIDIKDSYYEEGKNEEIKNLEWKKGYYLKINKNNKTKLIVVNAILPPSPKELNEVRGLVTADYQNQLESDWIKSLRNKYSIHVNKDVLENINE